MSDTESISTVEDGYLAALKELLDASLKAGWNQNLIDEGNSFANNLIARLFNY